jgi:hypothetical protein
MTVPVQVDRILSQGFLKAPLSAASLGGAAGDLPSARAYSGSAGGGFNIWPAWPRRKFILFLLA